MPQSHAQRITLLALRTERASAQAAPYESLEVHLVRWGNAFADGLADLRAAGARIVDLLPVTVLDADGGRPYGDDIAAMPLDNVSSAEAVMLCERGWQCVRVRRVAPIVPGFATPTSAAIVDWAIQHARHRMFTYYESTGWLFLYPKSCNRALRARRRLPTK